MEAQQIICDTDVIIDFWSEANARHVSTKAILENKIGLKNVVLSAITKIELLVGAVNKTDLSKLIKNLDPFIISAIDKDITSKAIELVEKYSLSHSLELADSLIAATAISMDLELFTYNTKDYKFIPELKLFNH
jgi:predicted nucleic acid-binding protein